MTLDLFLFGFSIFAIFLFLSKRGTAVDLSDVFRKGIATLSIILLALSTLRREHNNVAVYIVAGLTFGMLGDLFLDLKYVYQKDEKTYLVAGITAFSLGHLCYAWGMAIDGALFALVPVLAVCTMFLITFVLTTVTEEKLKLDYGSFRPLIILYSSVISIPLTVSAMALLTNPSEAGAVRFVAMILFFISDLILSFIYFKKGSISKKKVFLNHLCYYLAQIAFAISLNINNAVIQ